MSVFLHVIPSNHEAAPLAIVEEVRCLECGATYTKPSSGSTVTNNPGCPECGYVGWVAASVPVSEELEQRRFGVDRLRLRGV